MKYILALFLGLMSVVALADDQLNILAKIPSQMLPGQTYNIELYINKGNLTSYAYFEQDLPAGITAKAAVNDNADFEYDAGTLKLTWLRLPAKPTLRVVYSITVPADTSGIFNIGGKFSYIVNNKRGQVDLKPTEVLVGTSQQIGELLRNRIAKPKNTAKAVSMAEMFVKREQPDYTDFDKTFSIILLVKTEGKNYPLRIEEELPDGFTAKALHTAEGKFSAQKNKVVFEWDVLPEKKIFTVSYFATNPKYSQSQSFDIKGKYQYKVGKKAYAFFVERNYGGDKKKPSLEEIRQKQLRQNMNPRPDTTTKQVKAQAPVYNKASKPDPKDPNKASLNDVKNMFK